MLTTPKEIHTNRFVLKPLEVNDVGPRYAGWLRDQATSQFIITKLDLAELRQYVLDKSGREDVMFLGIFEKGAGLHIGNIKYEPVNSGKGYSIMGILIGEDTWRGKGVAAEVITASAEWLRINRNIREIILGVNRANLPAISAYRKLGFIEESSVFMPSVSSEGMIMVWHLCPSKHS
jgi:RimJ/RimL family protein N-acetyltransferase